MKAKIVIPTMIALVAVVALALPSVMAESGYDYKHTWQDGYKKHHKVIEVTGFEGTIKITEGVDKHALKEQVTVSLSEATAAYPDAKKAKMGIAVNEDGDKFLVWKVIEKSYDHETHIVTKIIHVVDAADKDNTVTVTKQFDKTDKMQKHTQYKEMREAFDALSQEDRDALKSHFRDMKGQHEDLTEEERQAKHTEFKQQMETFAGLSLEEKISYLEYLAISIRNQV